MMPGSDRECCDGAAGDSECEPAQRCVFDGPLKAICDDVVRCGDNAAETEAYEYSCEGINSAVLE